MYEKQLPNGIVEVHTTTKEFTELYKTHTANELAKIYNIPVATIRDYLKRLNLRKR